QGIARHIAAVAPSPNANAVAVDKRLALKPRHSVFQVSQFQFTEILVDRPGRFETLAAAGAIVEDPNDVSLLSEQRMPHVGRTAPCIFHLGGMWPAVGELEHRILL